VVLLPARGAHRIAVWICDAARERSACRRKGR
jgi:hypothetical protein